MPLWHLQAQCLTHKLLLMQTLQAERGLGKSSNETDKPIPLPDQLVTPPADNLAAGFDDEHVQVCSTSSGSSQVEVQDLKFPGARLV